MSMWPPPQEGQSEDPLVAFLLELLAGDGTSVFHKLPKAGLTLNRVLLRAVSTYIYRSCPCLVETPEVTRSRKARRASKSG